MARKTTAERSRLKLAGPATEKAPEADAFALQQESLESAYAMECAALCLGAAFGNFGDTVDDPHSTLSKFPPITASYFWGDVLRRHASKLREVAEAVEV
jgi:hypothetical protein